MASGSGRVFRQELTRMPGVGFGFSVLGGAETELPPVVYDIVPNSPAGLCGQIRSGDVILAIGRDRVDRWTTKEVVKALRNSGDTVTLQLRADPEVREKVRPYLVSMKDMDLSKAITPQNLKGVTSIRARTDPVQAHQDAWKEHDAKNSSTDQDTPRRMEWFIVSGEKMINVSKDPSQSANLSFRMKKQRSAPAVANSPPKPEGPSESVIPEEPKVADETENEDEKKLIPDDESSEKKPLKGTGDQNNQKNELGDSVDSELQETSPTSSLSPSSPAVTTSSSSSSATAGNADHRLLSESSTGGEKSSPSSPGATPIASPSMGDRDLREKLAAKASPIPSRIPIASERINRQVTSTTTTTSTKTTAIYAQEHRIVLSVQGPKGLEEISMSAESSPSTRRPTSPPTSMPSTSSVSSTPPTSPATPSSTSMAVNDGSRARRVSDSYGELVADDSPPNSMSTASSQSPLPPPFPLASDVVDGGGEKEGLSPGVSPTAKGATGNLSDADRSAALRLAKRLFALDGFQPRDVLPHLCKKNEFSRLVGDEYLRHFDFAGKTLEESLREFLGRVPLEGETQERERVLARFADRFFECNPGRWSSPDAAHTLVCAMMVLNTDLHSGTVGKKRQMTLDVFADSLSGLNDGLDFPAEMLTQIYRSVKENPFVCQAAGDSQGDNQSSPKMVSSGNPFLELPDPNKSTEYKRGYFYRKCVKDPGGRLTGVGKRGWNMWYGVIRDLVLLLYRDDEHAHGRGRGGKGGKEPRPGAVIHLHHAIASVAHDYVKRKNVFRICTVDQAEFLFLSSDDREMQSWIDTINWVCAKLSAPALSGGVGSCGPVGSRTNVAKRFTRPLLPSALTRYALPDQMRYVSNRVKELEEELVGEEEALNLPKKKRGRDEKAFALEKLAFLKFEIARYKTYDAILRRNSGLEGGPDAASGAVGDHAVGYSYEAAVYVDKPQL